jgi:hypothetical protein
MRKDEEGNLVPETLGEYRDLCAAIGGINCRAVQILDEKIAESPDGVKEKVIAPDSQMRMLLMPMLAQPRQEPMGSVVP